MNHPIQNEAEMKTLQHQKSLIVPPTDETNEGTSIPIKDQDTMLSMTVLLLACLALAVLAHVFV